MYELKKPFNVIVNNLHVPKKHTPPVAVKVDKVEKEVALGSKGCLVLPVVDKGKVVGTSEYTWFG
jgi:hypothetical protein